MAIRTSCGVANVKFQLRRDSLADWTQSNPVLRPGEPGYDSTTNGLKIGDGTTNWSELSYIAGANGIISTGNTLTVDALFGNDTRGNSNPYAEPFKTIQPALDKASQLYIASNVPHIVIVNAGTYNESIVVPDNVSFTGTGAQSIVIQQLNVTTDTTLITMGVNSRVENFTARLTSSANVNLTGCLFPGGTTISAKLRNSIWTVSSTATSTNSIVGVFAPGTSSTAYSTPNAIQRSTINVSSAGTGIVRGIYTTGVNRFAVRDIVVNAIGSTAIGAEANVGTAVLEIKTSTIGGDLYDIRQPVISSNTPSVIRLSATDLVHANADATGFATGMEPSHMFFTVRGNFNTSNSTYYMTPGTTQTNDLSTTPIGIPFVQDLIVFEGVLTFNTALPVNSSATINLYNSISSITLSNPTPFATMTLTAGQTIVKYKNTCSTIYQNQYLIVEFKTGSAAIGQNVMFISLGTY